MPSPSDNRDLLRFLTCGSVDDGKSTLIGRLLFESGTLYQDQLASITKNGEPDYSLLLDGLQAEREQSITIDVAYRYLSTSRRRFIIADTPGHEQYTRNMVTGASNSELAVILIDVTKGITRQTSRHLLICSLLGIKNFIVAVNKMDLVNYDENIFRKTAAAFNTIAKDLGGLDIHFIPVSAKTGTQIVKPGRETPWYEGPSLLELLETIKTQSAGANGKVRFPVQLVVRNQDQRRYCGNLISGQLTRGQEFTLFPGGMKATVKEIFCGEKSLPSAELGQALSLTLSREMDVSRGDWLIGADEKFNPALEFSADIIWMSASPLKTRKVYEIRSSFQSTTCFIRGVNSRLDLSTLKDVPAVSLDMNDIGHCEISLSRGLLLDCYDDVKLSGAFIIIDRATNETVAAGMVRKITKTTAIPVANSKAEVIWEHSAVTKELRAAQKNQVPLCIWFTGLPASGKSTLANFLEQKLFERGIHTMLLDGDNLRHGLSRDLGMTSEARSENIRRVAHTAKLMLDSGLVVITALVSPFSRDRQFARSLFEDHEFVEVFVDTPLEVCIKRDPKGMYQRAINNELPDFTGISSPYERPKSPEISVTTEDSIDETINYILSKLKL
jgi:bifunctional enzyme CysN/CysC